MGEWKFTSRYHASCANCELLILQVAVILDMQRMVQNVADGEKYEAYCYSLYQQVLQSKDEGLRTRAASSIFECHMRKNEYDKAESYLSYFSKDSSEGKLKKARFLAETKRIKESYKAYEELLFANYAASSAAMHGIFMLALEEKHMEKAHSLVEKQIELATCFEMGKYYEASCKLEIATIEKDADAVIQIMQTMLANAEDIYSFRKSPLYEHMDFKEPRKGFGKELKENLKTLFQDQDCYGFLKK